jgi:cereblon
MRNSNASLAKMHRFRDEDSVSESNSEDSFESALSLAERRIHHSAVDSCYGFDIMDESTSSDDDILCESDPQLRRPFLNDSKSIESLHADHEKQIENAELALGNSSTSRRQSCKGKEPDRSWEKTNFNQFRRVPRAFWPFWVYRMYDSYCLAERAAGSLSLFCSCP